MTPKERVQTAIAHRQPDRVPIDYYARSEISEQLAQRLGLHPGESIEERLGVDLRGVGPAFKAPVSPLCYADPTVEVTPDGLYRDIWGVGFRLNQTGVGAYMDLADSPLRGLSSIEELEEYPWPSPDLWDYSTIAGQAEANRPYWVWAHSRGTFEISWFLRGFNEFLLDLVAAPDLACALMDHVQAYLMERTRRILEAGRGLIDMVEYNDDVGAQGGLLMHPNLWRRYLKPRMAAFIRMCKDYGVAVRYHSCGGVRAILPDLIEIGVDMLTPVQTAAAGMEPAALKRDFGDHITFHGGVDTQELLPYATPDVVRAETARLIDTLGRGGGYVLAPSHVFQADVPVENVLAVYEAALGRRVGP